MDPFVPSSFGWQRDLPDFRDFTCETDAVVQTLRVLKPRRVAGSQNARVDLREYFPDSYNQGRLPSSPAHACAALLEYFERRSHGRELRTSRLFLHFNAHRMAASASHEDVNLRATFKAAACCGLPPERLWPYDPEKADFQPDPLLYSFACRCRELQYVRLDIRGRPGSEVLDVVRAFLAAGFPVAFGLAVPTSISLAAEIPYRPTFDSVLGGQSLLTVGHDDRWSSGSRGALLVRNSWGKEWGDQGYGWLPYAFVEERLAVDFWTVLRPDWLASGEFLRPAIASLKGPTR